MIIKLLKIIFFKAPKGNTLQERYPANPKAFVTHYSSVELPEEAYVKEPRKYDN